jgi:DNA-binding response OmpR family regulator
LFRRGVIAEDAAACSGIIRTLDQVIVQLRKKLGDNGDDPKHLLTVHDVGYKLVL